MSMDEQIIARMAALGRTDLGVPGSELYLRMDGELGDLIASTAMDSMSARGERRKVLVTSAISTASYQILSNLFPATDLVLAPMSQPIGLEIEVLKDVLVQTIMEKHPCEGRVIHVGGTQDQHMPYGRKVHCELPESSIGLQAAARRREQVLYGLYKCRPKIVEMMGKHVLPYAMYHDHQSRPACVAPKCVKKAEFMLFDILTCPMTQTQVCAAMTMHACDIAEVMVPVEVQSLGGGAGLIPGTGVRAVHDYWTDLINYDSRVGRTEFPATPRSAIIEFLHVACVKLGGHTFKFEIQESYGFFQRICITRVQGSFPLEVRHSTWIGPGEGKKRITVPILKGIEHDAALPRSYRRVSVVVDSSLYETAFTYAMALERKQLSVALIRTKVASINDRVVIKGTTVELNQPLEPIVLDVVSVAVFLSVYEEKHRATESIRIGAEHMAFLRGMSKNGMVRDLLGSCVLLLRTVGECVRANTIDVLVNGLDRLFSCGAEVGCVSVRDEMFQQDFVTSLWGFPFSLDGWHSPFVNPDGPGGLLAKLWRRSGSIDTTDAESTGRVSEFVYSEVAPGHDAFGEEERFRSYEASLLPEMEVLDPEVPSAERPAEHQVEVAELLATHIDSGPKIVGTKYYDRIRAVAPRIVDVGVSKTVLRQDPCPIVTLSEAYCNVFPDVAQSTTMRFDYDRFEEETADFAVNAPFLRFPTTSIVPKPGKVFLPLLKGVDRANARPSTRNMLAALIKRNADPNVIKQADDADLPARIWSKFKTDYCREDIEEHLVKLKSQQLTVGFPQFLEWVAKADPKKVERIREKLTETDTDLFDLPLSEFVGMFKGAVKPTLSPSAQRAYAKFQTIVYYEDPTLNALWSPIMMDVAQRFESCLAPQVYAALRGDKKMREEHLSTYWPYGRDELAYVQVDISEYDKSQESRARALEDLIFENLGMNQRMIEQWSHSHKDTVIRCLALGIKLAVAYQRKSGDATTALGNVMLNMMASAYVFGKPIVSIAQGDDSLILVPISAFSTKDVADKYAQLFNLPVKLITQVSSASSIPYAMSCFYVPDGNARRVYIVPDPIRAIESLQKPLADNDDKFEEKYVSFQERVGLWSAPYPMRDFERMVRDWFASPKLDVEGLISGLVALGKTKESFRATWSAELFD